MEMNNYSHEPWCLRTVGVSETDSLVYIGYINKDSGTCLHLEMCFTSVIRSDLLHMTLRLSSGSNISSM